MRTTMILGFAAALMVAGCGTTTGDRAASGALIGAAGGAVIGAAAGNPGLGAAAGAVAGGVVGAATDPCDLNLGDPARWWRPGRLSAPLWSSVSRPLALLSEAQARMKMRA